MSDEIDRTAGVPVNVLASMWLPLCCILLVELILCTFFVRFFSSVRSCGYGTRVICTLGLFTSVLTSSLLPADIFLVSFSKDAYGRFKPWATDNGTRISLEQSVSYSIYALYGADILFVFLLLPFSFFYNQQRDDLVPNDEYSVTSRCMSALKWTVGFVVVAGILLIVGALIPLGEVGLSNNTMGDPPELDLRGFESNRGEDALGLVFNIFSVIGLATICCYGAHGMASLPVTWVVGTKSPESLRVELEDEARSLEEMLNSTANARSVSSMRVQLSDTRRKISMLEGTESRCGCCAAICRPLRVGCGILFLLCAFLIVTTLTLTNVDRLLNGMGAKKGYVLPHPHLINPLNWVLVHLQGLFPLDFLAMTCLIFFLVGSSVAGIQQIGICICCVKLYKIRAHKTKPEAMLFVVFILMFCVMAINVLLYSMAPGYYTFGSQSWVDETSNSSALVECAVRANTDECIMTRSAKILIRFFDKVWIFGVFYYWANWVFVVVFAVSFLYRLLFRRPDATSAFESGYDSESDFSDTEGLINEMNPDY